MKLWIVTFASDRPRFPSTKRFAGEIAGDPSRPVVSARVAAPIGDWATALLGGLLDQDLRDREGLIRQWAGEMPGDQVGVLSLRCEAQATMRSVAP